MLYILSYTHLITSSTLNECVLVHGFQNHRMSQITRNAKEYRSMTGQLMSQNLPKRSLQDFRHPNHFGANNRNVIITYRFLAVPVQANRDFFWHTDFIFQL